MNKKYRLLKPFLTYPVGHTFETNYLGRWASNESEPCIATACGIECLLQWKIISPYDGKCKPEEGDGFYFITPMGRIDSFACFTVERHQKYVDFGNCFKTKDEALAARDRIKTLLKEDK